MMMKLGNSWLTEATQTMSNPKPISMTLGEEDPKPTSMTLGLKFRSLKAS